LRLARQLGHERDQEDDTKRRGVALGELEHARVRLEACADHVALNRDDLPLVASRRLPGNHGLGVHERDGGHAPHGAHHRRTPRNAPPHRGIALAGGAARAQAGARQGCAAAASYRGARSRASLTVSGRPPKDFPLSAPTAASACASLASSTKAKPRGRPVSRSVTILTSCTWPPPSSKRARSWASLVWYGMFPTYSLFPILADSRLRPGRCTRRGCRHPVICGAF